MDYRVIRIPENRTSSSFVIPAHVGIQWCYRSLLDSGSRFARPE